MCCGDVVRAGGGGLSVEVGEKRECRQDRTASGGWRKYNPLKADWYIYFPLDMFLYNVGESIVNKQWRNVYPLHLCRSTQHII
jgi:hypothetical protein